VRFNPIELELTASHFPEGPFNNLALRTMCGEPRAIFCEFDLVVVFFSFPPGPSPPLNPLPPFSQGRSISPFPRIMSGLPPVLADLSANISLFARRVADTRSSFLFPPTNSFPSFFFFFCSQKGLFVFTPHALICTGLLNHIFFTWVARILLSDDTRPV